jgi:hypothetical protein
MHARRATLSRSWPAFTAGQRFQSRRNMAMGLKMGQMQRAA